MTGAGTRVFKYAVLPGFIPRIIDLFSSGFSYTAYLVAVIYQSVRLLPPGHPYLNQRNMGRYSIRNVIAEAANNLVFSWKTSDQVVIYFTVLIGLILLLAQFFLLIVGVMAQQHAFAQSLNDLFFVTSAYNEGPEQDYAFIMLDYIFGASGIFDSCISAGVACEDVNGNAFPTVAVFPTPFHLALQGLFEFYSRGIFLVGVFIILYFAVVATAETAATGTAFGQRFNRTWGPVRIIAFFALLVPLNLGDNNGGLNGAQLITLWTAKGGSNFATNGWGYFNDTILDTYLGDETNLIARPVIPEINSLMQFMFIAKTCKMAEEAAHGFEVDAYVVRQKPAAAPAPLVPGADAQDFLGMDFETAMRFSSYGNIVVRFGDNEPQTDPEDYAAYKGGVFPNCGEIIIPVTSIENAGDPESGAHAIQRLYYELIQQIWDETLVGPPAMPSMQTYSECLIRRTYQPILQPDCTPMPDSNFAETLADAVQGYLDTNIPLLIDQQVANGNWGVTPALREKGWVGAGIWYNRIAEMNGDLVTAMYALPKPSRYPYLMEEIAKQRRMQNADTNLEKAYDPLLSDGENLQYPLPVGSIDQPAYEQIAPAMHAAYTYWNTSKFYDTNAQSAQGNIAIDFVNLVFGTSGIFDMRQNADIHPLAQLSAIGKGMMEASLRNAILGAPGEKLAGLFKNYTGPLLDSAASLVKTFGTLTMAMSFVMYYILPALPFIYFLFGAASWIKSVFEAVVAMPLWALAHIVRMDGEGLPGPGASNGYYLLLEIFIRPILIVIGLVASITIFAALVKILNDIFELLVVNVTGFNTAAPAAGTINYFRGPMDRFFYTVIYVLICYLMGTSCFKLIDLVPNNVLRWMGVTVSTFKEAAGDQAEAISSRVYKSGGVLSGQIKGGALAAISV